MQSGKSFGQTQRLAEMQHSSFSGHNGAVFGVRSVAMGPEGLLYLATFDGLYRFDGMTFVSLPTSGVDAAFFSTIQSIFFNPQGDVLLMGAHGARVLMRQGRGQLLSQTDGEFINILSDPQQTPDGRLWAILNEHQLVMLGEDLVWHRVLRPCAACVITRIFADARGMLWVVVNDRLYRISREGQFLPTDVFVHGTAKFMEGLHSGF